LEHEIVIFSITRKGNKAWQSCRKALNNPLKRSSIEADALIALDSAGVHMTFELRWNSK
jgi:hypothetical protein